MTTLIAQNAVFYAGRTRHKGEVFEATAAHARVLLRTRQVRLQADDPPAVPVQEATEGARPRRQYRRRDMRAES